MIDFDKLFKDYFAAWYEAHKDECTADEAEARVPELYDEWAETPSDALGGLSPCDYLTSIGDSDALIEAFCASCRENGGASGLLIERIIGSEQCVAALVSLAQSSTEPEIAIEAMNVLTEAEADHPLEAYARRLTDNSVDEGVRETSAEILKEDGNADKVREILFSQIDGADEAGREILADVLVTAQKDERTFSLLKRIFADGANVPFAAGLFGKYGDERAAAILYPALDTCNYLEFTEIRNAIEELGGTVDDSMRDFSDDEFYKAIKHLK